MKVKLLVSRSGVGFCQNAGDVVTVDDQEGLRMVKAGQADAITTRETTAKKQTTQKRAK